MVVKKMDRGGFAIIFLLYCLLSLEGLHEVEYAQARNEPSIFRGGEIGKDSSD